MSSCHVSGDILRVGVVLETLFALILYKYDVLHAFSRLVVRTNVLANDFQESTPLPSSFLPPSEDELVCRVVIWEKCS